VSSEALLALALVAVYLADSAHFLAIGEALIRTRSGRTVALSFGWPFELAGRRPFIPNPLTPFWPELRLVWTTSSPGGPRAVETVSAEMRAHLAAVRPVAWLASCCAVLIVIVAPLALAVGQQPLFVVAALLTLVLSAAACALVASRRKELGLAGLQLYSTLLVALVCLPCAGNLARSIAAQRRWSVAAAELPALGFEGIPVAALRATIQEALAAARRVLAEDSPAHVALSEQLRRLEGEAREGD
jgi:hypothetical protein